MGRALGLLEGAEVSVSAITSVQPAKSATVVAATQDDMQVAASSKDQLQETLLKQVGVVYVGLEFPVRVNRQTMVLRVTETSPASTPVLLQNGSSVECLCAAPPQPAAPQQSSAPASANNTLARILRARLMPSDAPATPSTAPVNVRVGNGSERSFLPVASALAFATPAVVRDLRGGGAGDDDAQGAPLPCTLSTGKGKCCVALARAPPQSAHVPAEGEVWLPDPTARALQAEDGGEVRVQVCAEAVGEAPLGEEEASISATCAQGLGPDMTQVGVSSLLAAWCAAHREAGGGDAVPVGPGTVIAFTAQGARGSGPDSSAQGGCFAMTVQHVVRDDEEGSRYLWLDESAAASQQVRLTWREGASPEGESQQARVRKARVSVLPAAKTLVYDLADELHRLATWTVKRPEAVIAGCCPPGVLLEGPAHSGKTTLLHALAQLLPKYDTPVHLRVHDCADLVGKPLNEMVDYMATGLKQARASVPCVFALDNADALCGAGEGSALTGAVTMVLEMMDEVAATRAHAPVAMLATVRDTAALHPALVAPGRFGRHWRLPGPAEGQRAEILHLQMGRKLLDMDADDVAGALWPGALDGYDANDLHVLADRVALQAAARRLRAKRDGGSGAAGAHGAGVRQPATKDDLVRARQGHAPSSHFGASADDRALAPDATWDDIGGMSEAKAALHEVLTLPKTAPALLASAPLRLRTGLLLYGPPGCGKTHAVRCAVAAAGMRMVTVKGPELLNKYIGASEAAVRGVFARAQAAAPCALFFDEIDALAPQRGHDNTGVTDRVVNQMLTELDGVQGLAGVVVLAASSRPDLIDAALLRPGRLDRLVACGLPDAVERAEILQACLRGCPTLDLGPDVLRAVAAATEGFTGADIEGVASAAREAAAVQAEEAGRAGGEGGDAAGAVTRQHLDAALHDARPSLPARERALAAERMRQFVEARTAGAGTDRSAMARVIGTRATLA
ncbi:unnamed protein product [Pedinophyceae sp. YPF-701]|nr:unnamed protein product [Pedinophyceae sp. YPF-701]